MDVDIKEELQDVPTIKEIEITSGFVKIEDTYGEKSEHECGCVTQTARKRRDSMVG